MTKQERTAERKAVAERRAQWDELVTQINERLRDGGEATLDTAFGKYWVHNVTEGLWVNGAHRPGPHEFSYDNRSYCVTGGEVKSIAKQLGIAVDW